MHSGPGRFGYSARIFSGSTLNLRAEVLRCGPPGIGAYLREYVRILAYVWYWLS